MCVFRSTRILLCIVLNVWNISNFSGVLGDLGKAVHFEGTLVYTSSLATHTHMHSCAPPPPQPHTQKIRHLLLFPWKQSVLWNWYH